MSETKFKVRYSALLLKNFTASDIIRVTNLNPESVRTELQRMRQEGLITSTPHLERQKKRGGRPSLYSLVDDAEKLIELSRSVDAYYPPLPLADKPSSRFYKSAKKLIDQILIKDTPNSDELLSRAESDLEMAEHAEGGILATTNVKAYLEFERARIMYLSSNYEQALSIFRDLKRLFESKELDAKLSQQIDEYILCINASRSFNSRPTSKHRDGERARHLLNILKENTYQTESPLTVLLIDLLRDLSRSANKELIASIVEEVIGINSSRIEREELKTTEKIYPISQKSQTIVLLSEQKASIKRDEAPIDVSTSWPRLNPTRTTKIR
jgi:hypothetical protein